MGKESVKMPIKISVIVPTYNAEEFISNTIEDLRNQTYSNLEIIIVNDGSTDDTKRICEKKAEIDKRIVLINKENGGAPSARNAGLAVATGDYVGFMDADDRIDPQMYEFLAETAEKNHSDLVACKYKEEYTDDIIINKNHDPNYDVIHFNGRSQCLKSIDCNRNIITTFTWNKIFRKDLIDGFCFHENMRIMDDIPFVYNFVDKSTNIQLINVKCYHYKYVLSSLTKASKTSIYLRDFEDIEELIKWTQIKAPEISTRLIQRYIYWNAKALEPMVGCYDPNLYIQVRDNIRKYNKYIKTLPNWEKIYVGSAAISWPLYFLFAYVKILRKRIIISKMALRSKATPKR